MQSDQVAQPLPKEPAECARESAPAADPLVQILDELRQLREQMADAEGIVPNRVYTPRRAAALLAITSVRAPQTLAAIPDLPYVPVGPNGGLRGYLGRDLLAYIDSRRVEKAS